MSYKSEKLGAFNAALDDVRALDERLGSSLKAFDYDLRKPILEAMDALRVSLCRAAEATERKEVMETNFQTLFDTIETLEERLGAFEKVGPDRFATAGIDVQTSSDGSCTCGISIVEHPVDAHTRIRETLETAAAAYRFSLEITDDNDSARMARTADDLHAEARRLAGLEKTA